MRDRQPPQQPPPVQKVWLRYAKLGRARYASHRDFTRAFERALRRAELPMAYSSGFNPHPRISWADSVPTGAESLAEYVELGLAQPLDPLSVGRRLDAQLPSGCAIVAAGESGSGSLNAQLDASWWELELRPALVPPSPESGPGNNAESTVVGVRLAAALERFWALDEALVSRQTKHGERVFDVRGSVVALTGPGGGPIRGASQPVSSGRPFRPGQSDQPPTGQSGPTGQSDQPPTGQPGPTGQSDQPPTGQPGQSDPTGQPFPYRGTDWLPPSPGPKFCPDRAAAPLLGLIIRHQIPLVRPDDVAQALGHLEPALAGMTALVRRIEQGRLAADGAIEPPLALPAERLSPRVGAAELAARVAF